MTKSPLTIYCQHPITSELSIRKVEALEVGGIFPPFKFFIHQDPWEPGCWNVSELRSGRRIAGGKSQEWAIQMAKSKVKAHKSEFPAMINRWVKENERIFQHQTSL